MAIHITENILRLDVSVTNTQGVNIGNRPHELVRVKFDNEVWHHLLHFKVILHHSVGCFRDIVHDDVQIHFVRFIAVSIKALPHFNTIRMV